MRAPIPPRRLRYSWGMGSHPVKYSDQQKDAIVAAVLDQGLSAREATQRAAVGELEPPPFDMPVSTAQTIVTDAKRRGRVADRDERIHKLVDDVLTVVVDQTDKLLAKARTGSLTARDATLGRRLIQMASHAAHLNNILAREHASEPEPAPEASSRLLERMRREIEAEQAENNESADTTANCDPPLSEREQIRQELLAAADDAAA